MSVTTSGGGGAAAISSGAAAQSSAAIAGQIMAFAHIRQLVIPYTFRKSGEALVKNEVMVGASDNTWSGKDAFSTNDYDGEIFVEVVISGEETELVPLTYFLRRVLPKNAVVLQIIIDWYNSRVRVIYSVD